MTYRVVAPELEALRTKLGITPADAPRLAEALTHGSVKQEGRRAVTNDRLAFLGDAVIELAIRADHVAAHPNASLGELSMKADEWAPDQHLATAARSIGLGAYLQLGKGAESERDTDSVLATALEAVIGAIFDAEGFTAAAACALRVIKP